MDEILAERLRENGENLRENYDDALIADVIGEVEALDDESSDETAEVLRTLADLE